MTDNYAAQDAGLARPRPTEYIATTLPARDGRSLHLISRGASDRKASNWFAILLDGDIEHEVNGKMSATISNDGWRTALIYRGEGDNVA